MRLMIGIPCMDMVNTAFFTSMMGLRKPAGTAVMTLQHSLIYDARNTIAVTAIKNDVDRLLMLDSDMEFEPDMLEMMMKDMDEGAQYVSGLCFGRSEPVKPCVYKEVIWKYEGDNKITHSAEPYWDYPEGKMFECAGTGAAAIMVSKELLKAVAERQGLPFQPLPYLGEDLSFCYRVRECGIRMWCDSRIKLGHVGQKRFDEKMYVRGA